MSEFITASIQRGGTTTIAKNIRIQVDKLGTQESASYIGIDPHFVYQMITKLLPISDPQLLRLGDLVIDQVTIDPKTSVGRRYRIISDPMPKALMMTWQWTVERLQGL